MTLRNPLARVEQRETPIMSTVTRDFAVMSQCLDAVCADHPMVAEGVYNTVSRLLRSQPDPVVVAGLLISAAREARRGGCGVCAAYLDSCRFVVLDLIARLS